jgi:glycosyltransferase involved in cell wall biosynthesis
VVNPISGFFTLLRETRGADVVHLHDLLYMTSWLAGVMAIWRKKPFVLTQHVHLVDHPSRVVRLAQRLVYGTVGRYLARRARMVFVLNGAVQDFVCGLGVSPSRIGWLPNGVDLEVYRPSAEDDLTRMREKWGLPADRPVVLYVGRLVPKKGFNLLLEVSDPSFCTVLVGGPVPSGLVEREGLRILGPLPKGDLAELYRVADIFALPSSGEGFPLSAQEAMATGLAVLLGADRGYEPYGLDAVTVSLVKPTVDGLRQGLQCLLWDTERRHVMGRNARAYAVGNFSWPGHCEQLDKWYSEAMV